MSTIAGHSFDETPSGRRCTAVSSSGGPCWRAWLEIRNADENDLGHHFIAHAGALNQEELSQIRAERLRERDAVWAAVTDAASAGSR